MLISLGVPRVLTSGGGEDVSGAAASLRSLVRHAAGRIEIMAGGGVTPSNAAAVAATGVDAVHASARLEIAGRGYSDIDEARARSIRDSLAAVAV